MKVLGVVLTVLGAFLGVGQFRRQSLSELRLGRALTYDLAVMKREICISRRTIPAICLALQEGGAGEIFWEPLRDSIEKRDMPVQNCWEAVTRQLPDRFSVRLAPLGPLLGAGGADLGKAIDEVREELLQDLRAAEQNMSASMRLACAVCFSGACFLILMLY